MGSSTCVKTVAVEPWNSIATLDLRDISLFEFAVAFSANGV